MIYRSHAHRALLLKTYKLTSAQSEITVCVFILNYGNIPFAVRPDQHHFVFGTVDLRFVPGGFVHDAELNRFVFRVFNFLSLGVVLNSGLV